MLSYSTLYILVLASVSAAVLPPFRMVDITDPANPILLVEKPFSGVANGGIRDAFARSAAVGRQGADRSAVEGLAENLGDAGAKLGQQVKEASDIVPSDAAAKKSQLVLANKKTFTEEAAMMDVSNAAMQSQLVDMHQASMAVKSKIAEEAAKDSADVTTEKSLTRNQKIAIGAGAAITTGIVGASLGLGLSS